LRVDVVPAGFIRKAVPVAQSNKRNAFREPPCFIELRRDYGFSGSVNVTPKVVLFDQVKLVLGIERFAQGGQEYRAQTYDRYELPHNKLLKCE
jgi:hypothetical protein